MRSKQTKYQPRLSDDVGEVLAKLADKNGRTLPQELDAILRPYLLSKRWMPIGIGPNGENAERSQYPSLAEELDIEANGLRLEWDERRKAYLPKKPKKK